MYNMTISILIPLQGFQVSDDEINMDLATFKSLYANSGDSVECVWLAYSLICHSLNIISAVEIS